MDYEARQFAACWRRTGIASAFENHRFGGNDRNGREAAVDESATKVASDRRLHVLSGIREIDLRGLTDDPSWAVAVACRLGQSAKQRDDALRCGSISRDLKFA
jgi:hypothetical protein